ncbi:TetR/AcrR family transcriptional regulator [Mycolicibacter minnesotensis]
MRTHGWAGYTPANDAEAVDRIVKAAADLIDGGMADVSILQVAKRLGVTRATVYRYFSDTPTLVKATLQRAAEEFMTGLGKSLAGITNPADAVVEGIALTLERLREHRRFQLLFSAPERGEYLPAVTSPEALSAGRGIVDQFDVDWNALGWSAADMDELVELMLRMVQSQLTDPGRPARTPAELRRFLHRWIGPAVIALHPTRSLARN